MHLRRHTPSAKALVAALLAVLAVLGWSRPASAATDQQQVLVDRYAPVVRLVADGGCEPGQRYVPINVDRIFGEPTVALRGPWGNDLVQIAPTAKELGQGLWGYHLDFPGDALNPGCTYLQWQQHLGAERTPTTYAHIVTEPGQPGKLALQYWFFYVFNDWNNLHEGDWEMIQLNFDAPDAAAALEKSPTLVGFSSHTGAEKATWGDDKLQIVDGTHPVVYPAAGSHANKFGSALYLGSSGEAGVGCDDTRGPHDELRPVVQTIPSDPTAAKAAFPWIAFEGRWGELQAAFFNGPPGPNMQDPWTRSIELSQGWRDTSYAVPTAGCLLYTSPSPRD